MMDWSWVASCRNRGQPGLRFPKRRTPRQRSMWLRRRLDEKPTSERGERVVGWTSGGPLWSLVEGGCGQFSDEPAFPGESRRATIKAHPTPHHPLSPLLTIMTMSLWRKWGRQIHRVIQCLLTRGTFYQNRHVKPLPSDMGIEVAFLVWSRVVG